MIEAMQAKIDRTEYWDMNILDFYTSFFGDEITILVYYDEETSWKITFLTCCQAAYETDAARRSIEHVRDMKKPQLGYYGQEITLRESRELEGFYEVSIDLSILTARLVCKGVRVEQVPNGL